MTPSAEDPRFTLGCGMWKAAGQEPRGVPSLGAAGARSIDAAGIRAAGGAAAAGTAGLWTGSVEAVVGRPFSGA